MFTFLKKMQKMKLFHSEAQQAVLFSLPLPTWKPFSSPQKALLTQDTLLLSCYYPPSTAAWRQLWEKHLLNTCWIFNLDFWIQAALSS